MHRPSVQPELPNEAPRAASQAEIACAGASSDELALVAANPRFAGRMSEGNFRNVWAMTGRFSGIVATVCANVALAHSLTPAEYGQFILITTAIGLASIAAMCGVNGSLMNLISESIGLEAASRGRSALRLGLRMALVTGPCVALATSLLLVSWHPELSLVKAVLPVALALLLIAWQQIVAEVLRALEDHRLANLFSGGQGGGVLTTGLFTAAFVLSGWVTRPSLEITLWLYALAPAVTLPIAIWFVRRSSRAKWSAVGDRAGRPLATIGCQRFVTLSGSLLLIQLLTFVIMQGDVWFAGMLLSAADLARYGAARRLLMVAVIPLQMINLTIAPSLGALFAAGQHQKLQQTLRTSATLSFVLTLTLFVGLAVGGQALLGVLFGSWYQSGIDVVLLLGVGQLIVAWCGASGYALVMTGRQKTEIAITLYAALVLVTVAPVAATYWGELGIACAVSLSAAVKCLSEYAAVRRQLGIDSRPDCESLARPLGSWWRLSPKPL